MGLQSIDVALLRIMKNSMDIVQSYFSHKLGFHFMMVPSIFDILITLPLFLDAMEFMIDCSIYNGSLFERDSHQIVSLGFVLGREAQLI